MKNQLISWLKPFLIFGFAIAILFGWIWSLQTFEIDFLGQMMPAIFFLFFFLVIEAASQANPAQVKSPFYNNIGKYKYRRDKLVKIAAIGFGVLAFIFTLYDLPPISPVLPIYLAILFYFGICWFFGTEELKKDIISSSYFGKYSNPTDKVTQFVALVVSISVISALSFFSFWIALVTGFLVYEGICLAKGTKELRDNLLSTKIIKLFSGQK